MAALRRRFAADELAEVRDEDLVAHPRTALRSLAGFLGWMRTGLGRGGAAVVDDRSTRSRAKLTWTAELVRGIERGIGRHEFLDGYGFET
jgi:hypothetical protein